MTLYIEIRQGESRVFQTIEDMSTLETIIEAMLDGSEEVECLVGCTKDVPHDSEDVWDGKWESRHDI